MMMIVESILGQFYYFFRIQQTTNNYQSYYGKMSHKKESFVVVYCVPVCATASLASGAEDSHVVQTTWP